LFFLLRETYLIGEIVVFQYEPHDAPPHLHVVRYHYDRPPSLEPARQSPWTLLCDAAYKAITGNFDEFGMITPANATKWQSTESTRGTFTLSSGDYTVNWGHGNCQSARGHDFVWYNQRVPLDGFGIQGYLIVGSVPTTIATNVAHFAALGLEWAFTELGIRMTLPTTQQLLTQQATDYKIVVDACLGNTACVGITTWDTSDD
ncbi:hypothetical protein FRB99_003958, partial [Tulasnella sp. 403]